MRYYRYHPLGNRDTRYEIRDTRGGFTLIELLVTVALTALLSSFVIVYSSSSRTQTVLFVEQAKIGQVVVRATSLAISTYSSASPPCGYGVHFDAPARAYALFSYAVADCASIRSIDPGAAAYSASQRFSLPQGIVMEDTEDSLSDIFFVPPDPKTMLWVRGTLLAGGSASVRLATADGTRKSALQVSPAGQISF